MRQLYCACENDHTNVAIHTYTLTCTHTLALTNIMHTHTHTHHDRTSAYKSRVKREISSAPQFRIVSFQDKKKYHNNVINSYM